MLRVKTHVAPMSPLSGYPPTMAVLPSADRAIAEPCWAGPTAPVPINFWPCWLQTPLLRVKTHVAPMNKERSGPPMIAVLPSPESQEPIPRLTLR